MNMLDAIRYYIVLFDSVNYTMLAEKILREEKIPYKIIPVPRDIHSDCGVCIRIQSHLKSRLTGLLSGRVEFRSIVEMKK
ncbi:MAG: DUF3343 domain-containing protein [bacterium]|nr:DUF3343 domain-containing protein [bacterium]